MDRVSKSILVVVMFPLVLIGQEGKLRFYEQVQLIPEYQFGVYRNYEIQKPKPTLPAAEVLDRTNFSTIGVSIQYKNRFLMGGIGLAWLTNWRSQKFQDDIRIQFNLGGNLLFSTDAAKGKSGLYFGPSFMYSIFSAENDNVPMAGYGMDLSFYKIYLRFSHQYFLRPYSGELLATTRKDAFLFASIGYGFNLNSFRKKENKKW